LFLFHVQLFFPINYQANKNNELFTVACSTSNQTADDIENNIVSNNKCWTNDESLAVQNDP
jgi:hypothetical protein